MIQPRDSMLLPLIHHYRVDALRLGDTPRMSTEYTGHDQTMAARTVGRLCMDEAIQGIVVFRNGDTYRRIEVMP